MKSYDLVLVVGYFRTATAFLSVVEALGKKLRIAVLPTDADPAMKHKTGDAHFVFLDLCRRFGADVLDINESAFTTLMVIQQFPYSDVLAKNVQQNVKSNEHVGLMTLAMAGIEKHDAFVKQFGVSKVYVPSQRLMEFLLEKREAGARYEGVNVKEVGLPFALYRIFPEFRADWMIAAPTLFSFHNESGKQHFLRTVNQLLNQIPSGDVVVYKPHNGNSLDYFAPRLHYLLASWLDKIPTMKRLLQSTERLPWPWLRMQVDRVETCILHRTIMRRVIPMAQLTPYAGISLEAFLPGVRKGVIGGLSNTIWGTLYFDLPFYNCVDEHGRQGRSELLDRRSDQLLDLNLQFFGVPFCQGNLAMDVRKQDIVLPHERQGDLIASIQEDLVLARKSCEELI